MLISIIVGKYREGADNDTPVRIPAKDVVSVLSDARDDVTYLDKVMQSYA